MSRFYLQFVSLAALVLLLSSPMLAHACLNDRDSDALAVEAKGLPETIRVISGRFERNPPLFYQMRIQRVQDEIAHHPTRLNLYDDIAVAYDRLGRDEEALSWIFRKRTRLGKTTPTNPIMREHWYRYYANVGTFRVHRWLRGGAKQETLSQMVQARDEIAHAVQIKPNAHFNREKYQLATMEWILVSRRKTDSDAGPLRVYLKQHVKAKETRAAIEGLSGLIVLGNAWESVDIFGALSELLLRDNRPKTAYFAFLRCEDLVQAGKVSLAANKWKKDAIPSRSRFDMESPNDFHSREALYQLNSEAEEWQKSRMDYLLPRLKTGWHPDEDPSFWKGYQALPPPALKLEWQTPEDKEEKERQSRATLAAVSIILLSPFIITAAIVTYVVRRRQRARATKIKSL